MAMDRTERASLDPLQQLAAAHGIAASWQDFLDRRHEVPESSLRALLRAMGVAAEGDDEVRASLDSAERTLWTEKLPPVRVVQESDRAASVLLRLPAELDGKSLELHIAREDGQSETRTVEAGALERLGVRSFAAESFVARRLPLPPSPLGYHRVTLGHRGEILAGITLIVTPDRCFESHDSSEGARVWGPALQLYGVRSQRNWGVGDFSDLGAVLADWRGRGANLIGLNPLHALFTYSPARASPYSPSNRLFLNLIYLDPQRIEDFSECEEARRSVGSAEFQTRLAELRASELVRYPEVTAVKLGVLEQLYASFRRRHLDARSERAREFREFVSRGGRELELHATFEALQEHFARADARVWGWPAWPAEYRDPGSASVARFGEEHRERVELYEYLQWQAARQLESVGRQASALGHSVGLYTDLAVSMDRGGAESWTQQDCLAADASIGAPPDEYNPAGQNWGLPPLIPARLVRGGFAPFVALLRANMRYSGALRIDHVMGLERLYWVPPEASPADGAYVSYPLEDLLGIVALESRRSSCLVVGEDLGTVSETVRGSLERHGILSYRLLYFERSADGAFKAPSSYPAQALAAATTHDLPTLAGFWEGRDIAVRGELGLYPRDEVRTKQIVDRSQARAQLLLALDREGLLPQGWGVDPVSVPAMTPELARAIYAYLARSPARLLTVQLEDVLGAVEQVNLPTTTEERYPNWQRKLTVDIESLALDERTALLSDALTRERPDRRSAEPRGPPARRAIIPRATYRLQLNASFTLRDATAIVPYLADLGVSHLYCSPYLRARPGSTHGYDIVDHNHLNPEIGDREDLERFVATLRAHHMGHLLDFVPNHVGIMGAENAWWMDVLENGEASVYAPFFDIDWQPVNPALAGKVLVPVLGDHYGDVLERGELETHFEASTGSLAVLYHEHRFPLDPRDYSSILERALAVARRDSISDAERAEVLSLAAAFGHLPERGAVTPAAVEERNRDKEVHKRRLAALCEGNSALAEAVAAATRTLAGRPGDARSWNELHALLESQAYRLAYWRVASDEINYRRFFDVNDLAALRMDNEAVFEATHRLVLELLAQGKVDGLRIDHTDGLYDPAGYFRRLQRRAAALGAGAREPDAPLAAGELPIYLVVEKITAAFERLPEDWAVHGTTGYGFANVVNGLLIDGGARSRLDRIYRAFIGEPLEWANVAYEAKRFIVATSLAAELNVITNQLARIAGASRRTRDLTRNSLKAALTEIIACFPVYRTYVVSSVSSEDRRYIDWAAAAARRRGVAIDAAVYDFVRGILLGEGPGAEPAVAAAARAFTMKLQQVTAPVTAKGLEDTAFYRFTRLVSVNEVGGDPDSFGTSVRAFHADAQYRARKWPHELLASSTHDTKRSEDVRARIDVLSEMPAEWRGALARWSRMNRARTRTVDDLPAPSRNDEYLLYETLVGTLPLEAAEETLPADYCGRIEAYMVKAVREAKTRSSWSSVNPAYETALQEFIRGILEPRAGNLFFADLVATAGRIARFGLLGSLSQTLLKLTAPGVPDTYQGTELWDFSLVDPDNRRPVDYELRRRLLHELGGWGALPSSEVAARARKLLDSLPDGRAKLYVISRTLQWRRAHEVLLNHGEYLPLRTAGPRAAHLCAFARRHGEEVCITVVPRLYRKLMQHEADWPLGGRVWSGTRVELPANLPAGMLVGLFDGARLSVRQLDGRRALPVEEVLESFPVALLAAVP